MFELVWIAVAISMVLSAAPVTGGGRTVNEKQLNKLAGKLGLPLPLALRQPVLARVQGRERSVLIWGLIGIGAGAVTALLVRLVSGFHDIGPLLIMVAVSLGMSVGSYRGSLKPPNTLNPEAPRVARARMMDLSDYTTSGEQWAVRLVPAAIGLAMAGALVVWALVPVKPAGDLLQPLLGALGATAVLGTWWVLKHARAAIVDRAQHASNDLELAWDDALRTMALRDLQDSAVVSGMFATLGLLAMAGTWVIPSEVRAGAEVLTLVLGLLAFGVGLACWALLLTPWLSGRTEPNPSLRLWSGNRFWWA